MLRLVARLLWLWEYFCSSPSSSGEFPLHMLVSAYPRCHTWWCSFFHACYTHSLAIASTLSRSTPTLLRTRACACVCAVCVSHGSLLE